MTRTFSDNFQSKCNDIQQKIESVNEGSQLKEVSDDIHNLKNLLFSESSTVTIPSFELKVYTQSLQHLALIYDDKKSEFLEKNFRFTHQPHSDLAESVESINSTPAVNISQLGKPTLENNHNEFITSKDSGTNAYFKGISSCTVSMVPKTYAASLTVEKSTNTIFRVYSDSFIFIDGLEDCVIYGSCQQLRVHNSSHILVALDIKSESNRFIMENCHDICVMKTDPRLAVDDFNKPGETTQRNYRFVDWNQQIIDSYIESLIRSPSCFDVDVNKKMIDKCII